MLETYIYLWYSYISIRTYQIKPAIFFQFCAYSCLLFQWVFCQLLNFCIIPVFGTDGQPVTEPDWHVWHEIRALGDNVVFGLRAPVHVGKYKMTAGRVRIELVQSSVWAAGANPPGCPCGQCPTHGGLSRFCPICSHHQVPLLCQIWIALLQRISTFGVPSFT